MLCFEPIDLAVFVPFNQAKTWCYRTGRNVQSYIQLFRRSLNRIYFLPSGDDFVRTEQYTGRYNVHALAFYDFKKNRQCFTTCRWEDATDMYLQQGSSLSWQDLSVMERSFRLSHSHLSQQPWKYFLNGFGSKHVRFGSKQYSFGSKHCGLFTLLFFNISSFLYTFCNYI